MIIIKQCVMCEEDYELSGSGSPRAKYCKKCKLEVAKQKTLISNRWKKEEIIKIWESLTIEEQTRRRTLIQEKLKNDIT